MLKVHYQFYIIISIESSLLSYLKVIIKEVKKTELLKAIRLIRVNSKQR